VYWCLPRKYFSDGLVCSENDGDIVSVIEARKEHKLLSLYVDRTNFVKGPDDKGFPDLLSKRRGW
jgi:tRNA-binding EMAP/Myf-like protein